MTAKAEVADLFVIGGGINGCGIARDAAGRGLSVVLAEKGDLAQATSSASTKLFHGGLRYLEYFEFRLVREALDERETLLAAMPHISWPMRFVLPYSPDMRFEGDTPTARLLGTVMPWMRGRRPAWLIRLGLFLYDTLGGRKILPRDAHPRPRHRSGGPAAEADVPPGLRVFRLLGRGLAARRAQRPRRGGARRAHPGRAPASSRREREGGLWRVTTERPDGPRRASRPARSSTPAGPWVGEVLDDVAARRRPAQGCGWCAAATSSRGGSTTTTAATSSRGPTAGSSSPSPTRQDFTLIGTTDVDHGARPRRPPAPTEERDYLLRLRLALLRAAGDGRGRRLDLFRRAAALRRRRHLGDGGDARLRAVARLTPAGRAAPQRLRRQDHHLPPARRRRRWRSSRRSSRRRAARLDGAGAAARRRLPGRRGGAR